MKFFIYAFLTLGTLQAMSKPSAPPPVAHNIGVRTLQYEDAKRQRPIIVELWYPTEKNGPFDENADVWIHPKEIRNVPVASRKHKYPLIVMSPGHGGDRRYLSWLVETLIKSGFIVASVEHHGSSWRSYNPLLSLRFWERPKDVSFAINKILTESSVKELIDPDRIGFVGYSLGGMTGLALAGAKAENVKEIVKKQQKNYKEIDLELVEQIDFTEGHANFLEPRIKSIALLSPAAFVFSPQSLKEIKIPVALVASEGDEVLPFQEHASLLIEHLVPAKLKVFRDKISHHVFLNRVSPTGKEAVRKEFQTDALQADQLTVHKEVSGFVADFFKETLR